MTDMIKWFVCLIRHDMQMFKLDKKTDTKLLKKISEGQSKETK